MPSGLQAVRALGSTLHLSSSTEDTVEELVPHRAASMSPYKAHALMPCLTGPMWPVSLIPVNCIEAAHAAFCDEAQALRLQVRLHGQEAPPAHCRAPGAHVPLSSPVEMLL